MRVKEYNDHAAGERRGRSRSASLAYALDMPHHQVDFFEIPSRDLAASKRFYAAAFGWTFQDWGDAYADIQGAGLSGGLRAEPADAVVPRGGPLVILFSDDLAASERAVTEAGATITERHEFPGGRRFHFREPGGAELAIWTKA